MGLKIDGDQTIDRQTVRKEIVRYFIDLYKAPF